MKVYELLGAIHDIIFLNIKFCFEICLQNAVIWLQICMNFVNGVGQGSFLWLQNKEGEPMIGGWLQIHQPKVLSPYFVARKKDS